MTLTADQIERRVEKMVDHLDRLLTSGSMSQRDYDKNLADLRRWEDGAYFANKQARTEGGMQ